MFDSEFTAADDAELIAAIEDGARAEAVAAARRLAAIAELVRRRVDDEDDRAMWVFDPWDSVAAEVAAALHVGHRRASGQMRIAVALRDRLPTVAALFGNGALSPRVVSTITWCTQLVDDNEALGLIDAAVAERATGWGPLSEDKLRQAIDVWVGRYDPDALRRATSTARSRDLSIGDCDDDADTTALWGRLLAADAAVLQKRVTAMAHGVCQGDPRSMGERRSDALGALANRNEHLACACGSPACPVAGQPPTSQVVIRVIAEQAALEAAHHIINADTVTPHADAPHADTPQATTVTPDTDTPHADTDAPHADTDAPHADSPQAGTVTPKPLPSPALLLGHGVLSAPLLAEAIRTGATIKPIRMPSEEPEPGYRPSPELAEFVRMRDLFCRFPGCDVPAELCDIDHTRPWPFGPTHPSNLTCKCRKHHLMKTFWTGIGGWADIQLPDATLIWTSPTGKKHPTQPGCRLFFPNWDVTTAALPPPTTNPPPPGDRGLMMPRRKRTRTADNTARIKAERAQGETPPF
jgi:Domain of unknown function (DUF222)